MNLPADFKRETDHGVMHTVRRGGITKGATLSPDGKHRYYLFRDTHQNSNVATFVMLNPSTADHEKDDPTIRRCMDYALRWNCGVLQVINLFSVRSPEPSSVTSGRLGNPVGPSTAWWWHHAFARAWGGGEEVQAEERIIVCAWGTNGSYQDQDLLFGKEMAAIDIQPRALKLTKDGHPSHPLYLSRSLQPQPFTLRKPTNE